MSLLLDRYEIVRELGRGGMGVVYLAQDTFFERPVALKQLLDDALDERAITRVRREATNLSRLGHENIVEFYDLEWDGGRPLLSMEWVDGRPLRDQLRSGGLSLAGAVGMVEQICRALSCAHGQGIIHRDLKPENVLVTADGRPKIVDFGLSRQHLTDTRVTTEGKGIGTLAYMAPEQISNRDVDLRADLYALGAMLYEMCCGRPPFVATEQAALLYKHFAEAPVPCRQLNERVPEALERLVLDLLAKSAEDRPSSADAVLARLAALSREELASAGLCPLEGESHAKVVPCFGREDALGVLRRALDRAAGGAGQCVLIEGEFGSGRSRLVQEVGGHAGARGVAIWRGASEGGDDSPLQALAQIFTAARWETADMPGPLADAVGRLCHGSTNSVSLESGAAIRPDDRTDVRGARHLFEDNLRRAVACLTSKRPAVLFLDDLDAASPELRQWLLALCEQGLPPGASLFLSVEDARREPVDAFVRTLRDHLRKTDVTLTDVALGSLTPAAVEDLVTHLVGGPLSAESVSLLLERTQGNPLTLIELVRYSLETGSITAGDGGFILRTDTLGALPDSLQALVQRRLACLDRGAVDLLTAAACIGPKFEPGLLAEMERRPARDVEQDLAPMLAGGLLRRSWEGDVSLLAFANPLVPEYLLGSADADHRDRHRRLLDALERQAVVPPQRLAQHAVKAGDAARALAWCGRAALAAEARHSYDEALGFWRSARRAAEEVGDGARWADLVLEEARILGHVASAEEAVQLLAESLPRLSSAVSELQRAHLLRQLGRVQLRRGEMNAALDAFTRAQEALEAAPSGAAEESLRIRTLTDLACARRRRGEHREALSTLGVGLQMADGTTHRALRADLLVNLGYIEQERGEVEQAEACFDEAVALAREAGDDFMTMVSLNCRARLLNDHHGQYDEALRLFEQALETAQRLNHQVWISGLLNNMGVVHFITGRWEDATRTLERALAIHRRVSAPSVILHTLCNLAEVSMARVQADEARGHLDEAWKIADTAESVAGACEVHLLRAALDLAGDHVADALLEVERAEELARQLENPRFQGRAELIRGDCELARGNVAASEQATVRAIHHLELASDRYFLALALRTRAVARAAAGRAAEASADYDAAVGGLESLRSFFELGRTHLQRATFLLDNAGPLGGVAEVMPRALLSMQQALKIFNNVGASRELDETRALMRRANEMKRALAT